MIKSIPPLLMCTLLLVSLNSYSASDDILSCVADKEEEFSQNNSRPETAVVVIDAPRAKGISGSFFNPKICETVRIRQSSSIMIDRTERLDGPPECEMLSASLPSRTRIIQCQVNNGIPTIVAEAWGKGCEQDNSVSYKITQNILPEVPLNTTLGFYDDCKSELNIQ